MFEILQPNTVQNAVLDHFDISPQMAESSLTRQYVNPRERAVTAGRYARLRVDGKLLMTDTPMERDSNMPVVRWSQGNVLIAGLGLGMILIPILAKSSVTSVTVVELHQSVIDLIHPQLQTIPGFEKLSVVQGDILTWKPRRGTIWDTIYFDIWPNICADNLPDMRRLKRRFRRHLSASGWMSCWSYVECLRAEHQFRHWR